MRLIDADKAKEKLRGNAQKDGNPFVGAIVEMFCEFLNQAPTLADRCVCCGDVIPEGRQVCPACEGGVT